VRCQRVSQSPYALHACRRALCTPPDRSTCLLRSKIRGYKARTGHGMIESQSVDFHTSPAASASSSCFGYTRPCRCSFRLAPSRQGYRIRNCDRSPPKDDREGLARDKHPRQRDLIRHIGASRDWIATQPHITVKVSSYQLYAGASRGVGTSHSATWSLRCFKARTS
jgi:hypothetical protein